MTLIGDKHRPALITEDNSDSLTSLRLSLRVQQNGSEMIFDLLADVAHTISTLADRLTNLLFSSLPLLVGLCHNYN